MLGTEKRTNPFLRWDDLGLRSVVQAENEIQTFTRLRGMKDRF
ncbi:hydroxyacylglutathione hydrolase C-terminal domain-containing protein [Leptothermofonsia sp. ETS-13]